MEAIILAGGFGTRLRPLTYSRAKPLLPILNKPMISYIIDKLPDKVDKVVLAVNYRKKQIEEYLKKQDLDKEVIVNEEPKPLGTGGAVKYAEEYLTDRFFVLNSDIICSLDLEKMLKFHKKNNAVSTISLWPVDNVSEFGVTEVQNDGRITGFVEKPRPEDAPSNLINAGAYLMESEILDYIETGKMISMEQKIFPKIIEDTGRFYGYDFEGYWMDIGRIDSYLKVHNFLLNQKNIDNFTGENNEIHGDIHKCCLGSNISIEEKTQLHKAIVYDNSKIEKNVTIENSVIGENTRIGEGSKIVNTVVGDNEEVKDNSDLNNEAVWNQPIPEGYPDKQIGNVIKAE
ncbi:MAG: NDP-sugar synthase [Candidatus Thermoplasmatota archaeon]